MSLDVRQVVAALNSRNEDTQHNLLAAYARANGAFYMSASGVWLPPATSGSTASEPISSSIEVSQ